MTIFQAIRLAILCLDAALLATRDVVLIKELKLARETLAAMLPPVEVERDQILHSNFGMVGEL